MEQHEIDFTKLPIARNTDPNTSHDSEAKTNATTRGEDMRHMLRYIGLHPHKTRTELMQLLIRQGYRFYRVESMSKRLYDLSTMGAITNAGDRECEETGHKAATWVTR